QGSLTHIVTAYSGCRAGYPVVWAAFDGAGHDPGPRDGCTCDGWQTWTSGVVWNFFSQFQSGGPSGNPSSAPPSSRPPSSAPPSSAPPSSAPPSSASPSSTQSSSPAGGRTCAAAYAIANQWPGGFQATVTVTAGASTISSWTVTWPFGN